MTASPPTRLLRSVRDFRRRFQELAPGDLLLGLLPLRPGEQVKLLDLALRGVVLFPSALAQLLSRSKVAQAEILKEFMLPATFVAYGLPDLTAQAPHFHTQQAVVSKRDQAHLGQGVSLWPSLEALHSLGALRGLPFPLVIQPFLDNARDLRVVVMGDYVEAYERVNPHGFRKNIFQGGSSRPVHLGPQEHDFCRRVMARGQFPYAILDVLVSPDGLPYLSEISLKGGLTGSRLGQAGFREQVKRLEEEFHHTWADSLTTPD